MTFTVPLTQMVNASAKGLSDWLTETIGDLPTGAEAACREWLLQCSVTITLKKIPEGIDIETDFAFPERGN